MRYVPVTVCLPAPSPALQLPPDVLRSNDMIAHMGEHMLVKDKLPSTAQAAANTSAAQQPRHMASDGAMTSPIPQDSTTTSTNAEHGTGTHLYQLVAERLVYRTAYMGPLRSVRQISTSFLSAPMGEPTFCYMNAVGIGAFMAWNPDVTRVSVGVVTGAHELITSSVRVITLEF